MVCPVPHTSGYSCAGPLVVVGVEGGVAISVGGVPIHTCAESGITPGHMDIKECQLALLLLNGELDVAVLDIEMFMEAM